MIIDRTLVFIERLARATRYYRVGRFSWRLAWLKSSNTGSRLA